MCAGGVLQCDCVLVVCCTATVCWWCVALQMYKCGEVKLVAKSQHV